MMLLEFTLRNYGPFRDEAVLSMEKDAGDEKASQCEERREYGERPHDQIAGTAGGT